MSEDDCEHNWYHETYNNYYQPVNSEHTIATTNIKSTNEHY